MSQKSKNSLLIPILVTCLILFLLALFLKNKERDNSELINVNNTETSQTKSTETDKDLSFLDDEFIDTRDNDSGKKSLSPEEKRNFERGVSEKLNMALMYKTPESVMKSVVYYQEKGNTEKVDKLILFLVENFPDYTIPENF